ncbi:DNA cytosine methyltransferase [Streptomyces sp. NBC_00557]|uniref:DNA cytosine methyltransferase n=1 Tax=Streptomyces sp. NBC_00557 TaxID=2975776 RepID=UPI002E814499|nr:DNA cytosine methyltransferase [Streptomyces sp. NBC_00557]WUC39667.1 DNA cytosine methyltransferase [Streptomyces sp. NBC_00557]
MTDDSVVDIVDLFAGPGGWDVAAQHLGLAVTGIENDHCACETRRAAGLGTVEGDVRDYSPADFPTATDLIGSPPCQPYSIGGKGAGRRALDTVLHFASLLAARKDIRSGLATLDDERTGLVLEPLRWVLAALDAGHPYRTVMLEQVPTVLPVWDAMAQILRTEGYTVVTGRLRAEEYGVPQTRVRAILVARRGDGAALPAPTHRRYSRNTAQDAGDPELQPWVSMAQALGWGMTHRPALTVAVGTAAGGPDPSCVGGSGSRATLYGERDAGRWIADTRLVPADSLPAYRGGRKDMIRVSVSDAAALQTFPPDHPFQGPRTKQYEQVGNAMPRKLAEAVIRRAMAPELATRTGAQAA